MQRATFLAGSKWTNNVTDVGWAFGFSLDINELWFSRSSSVELVALDFSGLYFLLNDKLFFRIHYKEYLVGLINKNNIDPISIMDLDELLVLVKRADREKEIPKKKKKNQTDQEYKELIRKVWSSHLVWNYSDSTWCEIMLILLIVKLFWFYLMWNLFWFYLVLNCSDSSWCEIYSDSTWWEIVLILLGVPTIRTCRNTYGPSIYSIHMEGERLRWKHVDGGFQRLVDVTQKIRAHWCHLVLFSCKEGFYTRILSLDGIKSGKFSPI